MKTKDRRTAIYIRVSTFKQEVTGYGMDAQLMRCQEYCSFKKINKDKIDIFIDPAESASSINRPQFAEMMNRVVENQYNEVIIFKLDRISRSIKDFAEILQVLNEHKTALISVNEGIDLNTVTGELIAKMLVIFAEFELNQVRLRTNEAIMQMLRDGKYPYGGKTPFGYQRDPITKNLVTNPREKKMYLDLIDFFIEQKSIRNTLLFLRSKYNYQMTDDKLYAILKNPLYTGKLVYGDRIYQMNIPKYISKEKHLKILDCIKEVNGCTPESYFFKGKIYCYDCDEQALITSSKKNKKKLYRYYFCPKCKKSINQDVLVNQFINTDFFRKCVEKKPREIIKKTEKRKRQLEEIARLKALIMCDIINNDINVTRGYELYSKLDKDEKTIEECMKKIISTETNTSKSYTYDNIIYVMENYVDKIIIDFKTKTIFGIIKKEQ